jgi:hypothetical protein
MVAREGRTEKATSWFNQGSKAVLRLYSTAILGTSVLVPVLLMGRVVLNLRRLSYMSYIEGAWLTCAFDFIHGVLYRPLFSPLGYGGTRFFPLYFVLTGSLSRIFGRLENSGLTLSAASVILLGYGCFVLLRRLEVSFLLSLAAAIAVLVAATTQEALLQTKGDGLAAMLNLWGITLCIGPKKKGWLYVAAILFSLAFAAKLTTVFGAAGVILAWTLGRRNQDAWRLGLATGFGYALVVSAMYLASGGRVFEVFRVCAGGGGSLTYALEAPLQMIGAALQYDPVMLIFFVPATAFAFHCLRKFPTEILPVYFLVVLLATTVIFGSRGTMFNHLIDLHVAAVLMLAYWASRDSAIAEIGTGIIALGLLVGSAQLVMSLYHDFSRPSLRAEMQKVLEHIPSDGRPVLAENAFVVLQSGKTPYLVDPYMFRVATIKDPALGTALWEKLSHRGFAAVVLQQDPGTAEGEKWYREVHFGGEFLQDLEANYSLTYSAGPQYVYTPKLAQP